MLFCKLDTREARRVRKIKKLKHNAFDNLPKILTLEFWLYVEKTGFEVGPR